MERIYCEYKIFGELEVFVDKPVLNYVEALEPCEVIKIPKESFLELIKEDSDFSLYIHIELSKKMYHTAITSKANITYSLKSRIVFFLWTFLDEHNLESVHKDIIVKGVGFNIRSVNRIIKDLVREDFIEYNKGFIKIKDMEKLVDEIYSPNDNIFSIHKKDLEEK